MFRALPESIVFYPSDAVSTEKIMELISKTQGIKYVRGSRPKAPVIYDNKEEFEIGGFKILKSTKKDDVVIIGAGITLHEALKAKEELSKKKISVAVIDLYCVKPLNAKKLYSAIMSNGGKAIIVEDHYPEGGIGEAVVYELSQLGKEMPEIKCLAVCKISCSGKEEELLAYHGIDSEAIQKEAMKMIKKK
jgi:transketolase